MPRPVMLWQADFGGSILLAAGNIISKEKKDLVAATGETFFLSVPQNGNYLVRDQINIGVPILSVAVGLSGLTPDNIFLGTKDRIIVYGNTDGSIKKFWETEVEQGANFTHLALADLDGDGREELIATASGTNTLFIYQLVGTTTRELKLQLLAIRELPGQPTALTTFTPNNAQAPYIAIAYSSNQENRIMTLFLAEMGLAEGPVTANLPVEITSLTAADLLANPGEELAAGGRDGIVRVFVSNNGLVLGQSTGNLGTDISALNAANVEEEPSLLVAGTPGAYVFGFYSPVTTEPSWAFQAPGPVNDLVILDRDRVAVGTRNGYVQVWQILKP